MIRIDITDKHRTLTGGINDKDATWESIMEQWNGSTLGNDIFGLRTSGTTFQHFGVLHQCFSPQTDCRVRIAHDMMPALQISLVTSGQFHLQIDRGRLAGEGCFNLNRQDEIESSTILLRDGCPASTLDINIPNDQLETVFAHAPHLMEQLRRHHEADKSLIMYADERMMQQPSLRRLARDIDRAALLGRNAEGYLLTKLREAVATFLAIEEAEAGPRYIVRSKMHDARDIILSRYTDMPSLHALAVLIGTNECTLKRAFREEFGTTVFQYLFDHRMMLAAKYLLDTTLPIQIIATRLGYDYQSHFCTAFKRKYGLSPSEFRKHRAVSCG